jgi:catechol 2,3-dioxygenase-like lactoylglutathione lyase family enzyme
MTLWGIAVDAPDARELAAFYRRMLQWNVVEDKPEWVVLRPPGGGTALSFQSEPDYVPPVWPADPASQQMMLHLDIAVADLASAGARAEAAGAVLAEYQPQADVRVYKDPAGHPFCLLLPNEGAVGPPRETRS